MSDIRLDLVDWRKQITVQWLPTRYNHVRPPIAHWWQSSRHCYI